MGWAIKPIESSLWVFGNHVSSKKISPLPPSFHCLENCRWGHMGTDCKDSNGLLLICNCLYNILIHGSGGMDKHHRIALSASVDWNYQGAPLGPENALAVHWIFLPWTSQIWVNSLIKLLRGILFDSRHLAQLYQPSDKMECQDLLEQLAGASWKSVLNIAILGHIGRTAEDS